MSEKKQSKLQWKVNLLIGLVLVLVLYIGINGIAFKHYYRQNVLLSSSYTKVGGQTVNLLKGLTEPLTIINYVSGGTDPITPLIANDVENLLEEYAYYGAKGKGKVTVRRIDPYTAFEDAKKLAVDYKLTTQENVIIVAYKGQHRIINYTDLANVDTSQMAIGGAPRVQSLKAEEAISSAIQSLSQGRKSVIYFLTGHGEYDPDTVDGNNMGYSILKAYLQRQNSEVKKLNLAEMPEIPADADLVVSACPKGKYNAHELDILQGWLQSNDEKGGKFILMLDPATETGLENFAANYGVTFQNDMVMGKFPLLGQTKVIPNAIVSIYPPHPAVEWLYKEKLSINLGPVRSLAVGKVDAEQGRGASVIPLAMTGALFWGETDYKGGNLEFDAAKDFVGPLNIAVAIDTASVSGGEVQLKGMKMVLIGGGQFLLNQVVTAQQIDFFINITNWMLGSGKPLGIAPKVPKEFTVSLEPRQVSTLITSLLLFPVAGLLAACMLWWKRR